MEALTIIGACTVGFAAIGVICIMINTVLTVKEHVEILKDAKVRYVNAASYYINLREIRDEIHNIRVLQLKMERPLRSRRATK